MDTSEQYIKMSEMAMEIQTLRIKPKSSWEEHNWKDGDFIFLQHNSVVAIFCNSCEEEFGPWSTMPGWIWLPRQDQLQEILGGNANDQIVLIYDWFVGNQDYLVGDEFNFNSMEQLWLVYAMKEKYGKTWDGIQWIE